VLFPYQLSSLYETPAFRGATVSLRDVRENGAKSFSAFIAPAVSKELWKPVTSCVSEDQSFRPVHVTGARLLSRNHHLPQPRNESHRREPAVSLQKLTT
jgi:hypothetical protein